MTYPVNNFYSSTYTNISANAGAATSVFDTSIIPASGYAMVLGIIGANKSTTTRGLNMTLQKSGSAQAAHLLFDVALPSQTSFQVIDGDKLVVQRGDTLLAWADSSGANSVDLVVSYVVYTPAS
jgi:ABC-type arginine transport system ATPase subunit